jgi:hypothetical protein
LDELPLFQPELHPVSTGHRRQPEDLGIVLGIRLCPTRFRKSK